MAMREDPRGRQFERQDYSRPQTADANQQQQALTATTDAPGATAQPTSNDSGHWSGTLPQGVDASWVRRIANTLVKEGTINRDAISDANLADPEHRKWLNRKLRKYKQQQRASKEQTGGVDPPPEGSGEGEELETGGIDPPATAIPGPQLIPSGRIPRGRLVERPTPVLGPGGYVPAGEGLWWPPYPTTGGPVQHPNLVAGGGTDQRYVLNAAGQAGALEGGSS